MDEGFIGFFSLSGTLKGLWQGRNASKSPTAATGNVTFRIYGESGLMTNGTGTATAFDSSNVTGLYQFSKALNSGDGYERGKCYTVRIEATVSAVVKVATYTFVVL
jgi:hypothetical protein